MRRGLWWMVLLVWLIGCAGGRSVTTIPGTGRLVRWSKQSAESPKKIIFIPGCVATEDPHGLNPTQLEDYFANKEGNFEVLGEELFGRPTSELAEYWFLGYYPVQDIETIATNVAQLLNENKKFDNSLVAVVAYSEGGPITREIARRRPGVLAGGAVLGGVIDSTPIAHKEVRDAAAREAFPFFHQPIISAMDRIAVGTEQLRISYLEGGEPVGRFKYYAGRIEPPALDFWTHNLTTLQAALSAQDWFGSLRSNRDFAGFGAMIIAASDWRDNGKWDHQSDGLVPWSSAIPDRTAPYEIIEDCDHWDLVTSSNLSLDRSILQWLDEVLQLSPQWVETDLPETPDKIELPVDVGDVLNWARFAYIDSRGKLVLTDESWERSLAVPIAGTHGHPQFDDAGQSLAFDVSDGWQNNIYVLTGTVARQISFDGESKFPAWSPNEQWLTYQSGDELLIHQLDADERYVVTDGVELLAPPVWTVDKMRGRLYFVNTNRELRWISPRERRSSLTNLVQSNCGRPLLAQSSYHLSGMIVISGKGRSDDRMVGQRVTVVTGVLANHFSADISYDPNEWRVDYTDGRVTLLLDKPFSFTEAAYDATYNHLYLVGEWDDVYGIYLLDIQAFLDCEKPEPPLSDFWTLKGEGASQLVIKPSW